MHTTPHLDEQIYSPSARFQTTQFKSNMEDSSESEEPSRKRPRLGDGNGSTNRRDLQSSLTGSVSPPPLRRKAARPTTPKILPSPFQLTRITDLPASSNVGAVTLKDVLGDPLIAECWEFNYLHNLDFLMNAFDEDIRDLVQVHVIHGFWKNEDPQRLHLTVSLHFTERFNDYESVTDLCNQ